MPGVDIRALHTIICVQAAYAIHHVPNDIAKGQHARTPYSQGLNMGHDGTLCEPFRQQSI